MHNQVVMEYLPERLYVIKQVMSSKQFDLTQLFVAPEVL